MQTGFADRKDAGQRLAKRLLSYAGPRTLVLALPRGGVPVGFEVARALAAPLDVHVVRKLGVPGHEELAMGAVASGGAFVLNDEVVEQQKISAATIERIRAQEWRELARRELAYRGNRPPAVIRDKIVIVVDDGLATGATMRAALMSLQAAGAAQLLPAAPVAAQETVDALTRQGFVTTCVVMPEDLGAVGYWYEDFRQTTDDEVRALLHQAEEGFFSTG